MQGSLKACYFFVTGALLETAVINAFWYFFFFSTININSAAKRANFVTCVLCQKIRKEGCSFKNQT